MSKPPPPPPGPVLNVTTANTTVTGTVNLETINALANGDTLIAGPGYEYLNAGAVGDALEGAIGSVTFAGLSGASNTTLIALPSLTATVPGVEVHLGLGMTRAGVTVSGTDFASLSMTYQQQFAKTAVNINNVIINDNGDNVVWGAKGATIVVNGNGVNEIFGAGGGDTITVNGSGRNYLDGGIGSNTLTGGSGQNWYLFGDGLPATKSAPSSYYHETITNFSIANDTLEFEISQRGVNEAPKSWSLTTVNGVASLTAVLGDGFSTVTLVGVTDPSHIHMENLNDANGATTQIPDVPIAGAAQMSDVIASQPLHRFIAAAASFAAPSSGSAIHAAGALQASTPMLARPTAIA
jgi:Ca2+-binding RTX toxin-like protein